MAHRRQVLLFIAAGVSSVAVGAAGLCCRPQPRLAENEESAPHHVICLECETPCYVCEWKDGKLVEATCTRCGNDDVDQFARPEDIEEMGTSRSSAIAENAEAAPQRAV